MTATMTTITATTASNVELRPGFTFRVNAKGTSATEVWEVKSLKENGKGEIEVEAKGSKTPYLRSFKPEQFGEFLQADRIITEEVELVGIIGGREMWVEKVINMPIQKRRGRKPSGYYISRMEVEEV